MNGRSRRSPLPNNPVAAPDSPLVGIEQARKRVSKGGLLNSPAEEGERRGRRGEGGEVANRVVEGVGRVHQKSKPAEELIVKPRAKKEEAVQRTHAALG